MGITSPSNVISPPEKNFLSQEEKGDNSVSHHASINFNSSSYHFMNSDSPVLLTLLFITGSRLFRYIHIVPRGIIEIESWIISFKSDSWIAHLGAELKSKLKAKSLKPKANDFEIRMKDESWKLREKSWKLKTESSFLAGFPQENLLLDSVRLEQ